MLTIYNSWWRALHLWLDCVLISTASPWILKRISEGGLNRSTQWQIFFFSYLSFLWIIAPHLCKFLYFSSMNFSGFSMFFFFFFLKNNWLLGRALTFGRNFWQKGEFDFWIFHEQLTNRPRLNKSTWFCNLYSMLVPVGERYARLTSTRLEKWKIELPKINERGVRQNDNKYFTSFALLCVITLVRISQRPRTLARYFRVIPTLFLGERVIYLQLPAAVDWSMTEKEESQTWQKFHELSTRVLLLKLFFS